MSNVTYEVLLLEAIPPWGRFGKRIVKVEPLKTNEFLNENQCENHYEDDGKE